MEGHVQLVGMLSGRHTMSADLMTAIRERRMSALAFRTRERGAERGIRGYTTSSGRYGVYMITLQLRYRGVARDETHPCQRKLYCRRPFWFK